MYTEKAKKVVSINVWSIRDGNVPTTFSANFAVIASTSHNSLARVLRYRGTLLVGGSSRRPPSLRKDSNLVSVWHSSWRILPTLMSYSIWEKGRGAEPRKRPGGSGRVQRAHTAPMFKIAPVLYIVTILNQNSRVRRLAFAYKRHCQVATLLASVAGSGNFSLPKPVAGLCQVFATWIRR